MSIFSNREIAIILLLILLFFYTVLKNKRDFFRSVKNIFKAFLNIKIIIPVVLMATYIYIILLIINHYISIEGISIKNLILWFSFSAIVLLFGLINISKDLNFFKNIMLKNLIVLGLIEYILNIYSFSLISELFLQFGIAILSVFSFVAGQNEDQHKIKIFFDYSLALLILVVVAKSITGIFYNYGNELIRDFLLNFMIPIILTISLIPFLYLMSLYIKYELLFVRLPYVLNLKKDIKVKFAVKKRILIYCGLNLKKLVDMSDEEIKLIYNDIS